MAIKTIEGQPNWAMWTNHKFWVVGPRECQSARYDRHIIVGWMVMTHHENHCWESIHLHKVHFQFGVMMTSCRLKSCGMRRQGDGVEELGPLSRRKRWTHMGGK